MLEVKGENGTEGQRPEGLKSKVKTDLRGDIIPEFTINQ